MKLLKTGMKIHHRKASKLGKENSELLIEYEKLKFENKKFIDSQRVYKKQIDAVEEHIDDR